MTMSADSDGNPAPDFKLLFEATLVPYLVLTPDLTMVAANEARLRATMTTREQIIGRSLFDIFPDNPDDPEASGVRNLTASLARVAGTKQPDVMPIQKYDIPLRGSDSGRFETRYWKPRNIPVLDAAGELAYIIHEVEDVTAQVLQLQAAEEGEARFRQIADAMPQIVWSALRDGTHDYFNRRWYDFIGTPEETADPNIWSELIHPDDRARMWQVWSHSLATGEPYDIEYRVRHRSGDYHWLLARALPIRNEQGDIERWMGTSTDITAQKLAEEARAKTETKFRKIVESDLIGIYEYGADGAMTTVNDEFLGMLGFTREEFERQCLSWKTLTPPEWEAADSAALAQLRATGRAAPFEKEYLRKDGSRLPVFVGATTFDETAQGGIAYVLDISELKKAQRDVQESEIRFRTLAENIPQLAWMADSDGGIFWYNNRWLEYTGTTLEEMRGWGWTKVHHPDYVDEVKAKYHDAVVVRQETWEDTFPLRGADGEYRWFLSRAVPIRDADGRITRWFGTNTDVTAQRLAEEELQQSSRRKDDFLAMLAHELRNPLAPISTAAALLRLASRDEASVKRASEIIARQVQHMTELVDDLLDVSRVTRGLASIEKKEVSLTTVIHSAIEQASPLIESRNHALTIRLASQHAEVCGDRTRLVQVVANLLNNAAKYTPQGGEIHLGMEVRDAQVRVCVTDNGIGMDASLLPHVFELFTQAERTPDRSQGGLGLGLALVKSIVALHGGSVTAESAGPGRGSTFTLTLPLMRKEADAGEPVYEADGDARAAAPLHIEIVDDNLDAAESLATLLREQGHVVTVHDDAKSALAEAKDVHPEVYILDIGLPDMDGYELSRQLHRLPGNGDATYIALTGYGQAHDRVLARAAGFNHYFLKPVNISALQQILARK